MNRKREVVLLRLVFVLYIGLVFGAFGVHFWTVKMAYQAQGRGSALVTFVFPVGAEIFWAIKEWRAHGFANLYTLAVTWYGVCCILLAWVLTTLENKEESGGT